MPTQPAFNVIGIETRTSNFKALFDIPKLWGKFRGENLADKIPGREDEAVVAVYTDYDGDHTKPYTLLIGVRVSSLETIPEGMVGRLIPEQVYTCYPVEGKPPTGVIETWKKIWNAPIDRAYKADFEVYTPDKTEIYVGLQSKK